MAGLFFCLASAEGAGLLFYLDAIQPHTGIYSMFCAVNAIIPPTLQNRAQGFTGAFPAICRVFSAVVWRVHPAILHRLRRAGEPTSARTACTDTRYHRHAGRYTGQHSRPIIIRYIRVRPCYRSMPDSAAYRRPCKPGGLQSGTGQRSGRTGSVRHPPPGGAVQ